MRPVPARSASPRRRPDFPASATVIALLLSRVAAGLGGFMAGTGLVHGVVAGNPWGFVISAVGAALLIHAIRQAARLSAARSRRPRR